MKLTLQTDMQVSMFTIIAEKLYLPFIIYIITITTLVGMNWAITGTDLQSGKASIMIVICSNKE